MLRLYSIFNVEPDGFKYGFQVKHNPDRICFTKLESYHNYIHRSVISNQFRFLNPTQLDQAQHLARFADISDAHTPESIARG